MPTHPHVRVARETARTGSRLNREWIQTREGQRLVMAMSEQAADAWWDALGDDELLRRLVQRGVQDVVARSLVEGRDTRQAARDRIAKELR